MNILKLAAMLTLDGTRFKAGLKEAQVGVRQFGLELSSALKGELAAVFGAQALIAETKAALAATAAIKDLAEQSRMTTDEQQRMAAAADNASLAWTDIAQAERQFNMHRREAVQSNEKLRETFAKYGMTLDDLQNPQLRFIDFLRQANAAMRNMSADDRARASVELFDMFGKVGPKLEGLIKEINKLDGIKVGPSREEIDRIDEADKKLKSIKRTERGLLASFASKFIESPGSFLGPGPGINLLETMMSWRWRGKMPQFPIISPFAAAQGAGGGVPSVAATKPPPLFTDEIAKKRREEFLKAQRELEAATMTFGLSKRASLEAQLREGLDFIQEAEDAAGGRTTASLGARKDSLGLLSQLMSLKSERPDVAALQRVGQLGGGRNFAMSGESELVKEARSILGVLRESKQVQEAIRDKKGKSINFPP